MLFYNGEKLQKIEAPEDCKEDVKNATAIVKKASYPFPHQLSMHSTVKKKNVMVVGTEDDLGNDTEKTTDFLVIKFTRGSNFQQKVHCNF